MWHFDALCVLLAWNGKKLTFPLARIIVPTCHSSTTHLASLKKLLNNEVHSQVTCTLAPFRGWLVQPRGERCQGRQETVQTPSQHHGSCVLHHICKSNTALSLILQTSTKAYVKTLWAILVSEGFGQFLYLRDSRTHITDFHQKPTVIPRTCLGAGEEHVAD